MPQSSIGPIDNVVKLIGEVVLLPGTSLLLDGNFKSGVAHAAIGLAARALLWSSLGAPIMFLVAVDSFSQSTSEKSLFTHITDLFPRTEPTRNESTNLDSGSRP